MVFIHHFVKKTLPEVRNGEHNGNPTLVSVAACYIAFLYSEIGLAVQEGRKMNPDVYNKVRWVNSVVRELQSSPDPRLFKKLEEQYRKDAITAMDNVGKIKSHYDFSHDDTINWVKVKGCISVVKKGKMHHTFYPSHAVKVTGDDFFKLYKKHYPDKMVSFRKMKKEFKQDSKRLKEELKKRIEEQEFTKKKKKKKEEKKQELSEKDKIKQHTYDLFCTEPFETWAKLGKSVGVTGVTAKKYVIEMAKANNDETILEQLGEV